jgi:hypothetical protein
MSVSGSWGAIFLAVRLTMAKTFVMAMTITMAKITSAAGKITVTLRKYLTLNEIHEL